MFIESVLKATQGKFFTVVFVKKDGTTRVMNARLGVSKHLKGGQSTLDPAQYLTVSNAVEQYINDNPLKHGKALTKGVFRTVKVKHKPTSV